MKQSSTPNILIVEPHPILCEGMASLLTSSIAGAKVDSSPDFADALERIRTQEIDLVITDSRIHGESAIPFLTTLSNSDRKTRCLVLSAQDESQAGYLAFRAGASGFIGRSAPVHDIVDAIGQILAGHYYCGTRLSRALMSGHCAKTTSAPGVQLTARELEVFSLIGENLTASEIATRLGLSIKTIQSHRENIKNKLGHQNSAQVATAAARWLDESSAIA